MEKIKQQKKEKEEKFTKEVSTKIACAIQSFLKSIATKTGTPPSEILKLIRLSAPELFDKINKLDDLDQITHIQIWKSHCLVKNGERMRIEDCKIDSSFILTAQELKNIESNQLT